MTEWLKNAWMGWQDYIRYGKLAALLLAALLYLLLQKKKEKQVSRFVAYSAVMGALCIFPPTAALWMMYQTRFYDYEWIWSLVPVTGIIALGATQVLSENQRSAVPKLKNTCYNIILTIVVIAAIWMSGSMGERTPDLRQERQSRENALSILRSLEESPGGQEVCLWAPKEILEYARVADGGITLLYGRNMWDSSLNAYSYDKYAPELEELYLWMEGLRESGEWIQISEEEEDAFLRDGNLCVEKAIRMGANRILLPGSMEQDFLERLAGAEWMPGEVRIVRVQDYYLLSVG